MSNRRTWSDENLRDAVLNGRSVRDVVRRLGLAIAGGSSSSVKKAIAQAGLCTNHFIKFQCRQSKKASESSMLMAFSENSRATRNTIKRLLKRHELIPYQCICGLKDEWQGKKLVLQLEHKNGIGSDNRLLNLEWLCANCHSQTSTYAGRKINREAWKDGAKISGVDYSDARASPGVLKRKVNFEEVKSFYSGCGNFRLTGKKFGISHQSVMNIIRNH